MSKDAKNVPALRFKGYSDAWEKRKLGEVVERVTRKNRDLVSTRPLTISAQDGLVDQRKFFSKTVASKNISNYFLLKAGDFAYNKSYSVGYPWGAVKRLDKYPSGVLSTLYIVFKPKKINSQFLVTYFEGTTWYVSVSKVASEGARNHGLLNISASDFFDQQLFFPTKKTEQESIGLTIKVLDDLIAATQHSIDALEQAKKALLQRLFDQSWRFKGYSDPWEKRKLSYFLHVTEMKNKSEIFSKKDVLSVSGEFGIVNQIELQGRSFAGASVKNYGVVEPGDVVYTKSPLKKNPFGIVKVNRNKAGIVSTLYAIYKPQTTLYSPIIDYYFQSDCRVNNYLRPLVNKGAKNDMKVRNVDVLKGNVALPSEKDEQRTIVGLLSKLDNLIAATQSRLSSLELLKKALLQDLFI
ncbi:restriction endonuclease subunit S [Lacticaseibacillus paracasei]|uniref:restriction endonuclease subunit S n=1 Tax=Lacticaseibacillus paracasei TaxID=1597 RepID=UPI001891AAFE|nr:restriction endonuclease subunit S [Lacticaseibacillus paracasei]QPB57601.1 restriction endonuclease subunit S [Lacticaseibacillus paracasei]WPQ29921.1 restriction endonuclease subunit S [Lacticaseibacillus paracasei]